MDEGAQFVLYKCRAALQRNAQSALLTSLGFGVDSAGCAQSRKCGQTYCPTKQQPRAIARTGFEKGREGCAEERAGVQNGVILS